MCKCMCVSNKVQSFFYSFQFHWLILHLTFTLSLFLCYLLYYFFLTLFILICSSVTFDHWGVVYILYTIQYTIHIKYIRILIWTLIILLIRQLLVVLVLHIVFIESSNAFFQLSSICLFTLRFFLFICFFCDFFLRNYLLKLANKNCHQHMIWLLVKSVLNACSSKPFSGAKKKKSMKNTLDGNNIPYELNFY